MLKSVVLVSLSLALTFSIVAPSILSILDIDGDAIAVNDFAEEEPLEQVENELDENEVYVFRFHEVNEFILPKEFVLNKNQNPNILVLFRDILVPPPQQFL